MDLEEALAQAETYSESEEIFVIDNDLRTITIPSGIQNVGVESDEDVRRLNFQMPKQYSEVDLSTFDIRINYLNANADGDIYVVTDKEVSGDYITFSWLLGRNAMAYKGSIRFIVCLKKTGEEGIVQQEFNTTIAQLTVLEGLETTQKVIQENPDVIEEILKRLDDLEENGGGSSTPGKDGVGIQKIEKTGTQGLVDTYTITLTNSSTYTFTVTNGQDGDPGAKGDPGQAATIQIGTVTTGEPGTAASVTNSGTANAAVLDFVIPKGAKGDPGESESGSGLPSGGTTGQVLAKASSADGDAEWVNMPAGDAGTARQAMQSTDTTVTLQPNILYVFPEMAELTVTLATPEDETIANEYHFFFTSGATATTLTLNDVLSDTYSIDANMKCEVSILEGVAYIKGVAVSET